MKDTDTVFDLLFDEPTEKYTAEKLDAITRSFRKIRGNWHTLNPYLQSMFQIIADNEAKQSLYRWKKENQLTEFLKNKTKGEVDIELYNFNFDMDDNFSRHG